MELRAFEIWPSISYLKNMRQQYHHKVTQNQHQKEGSPLQLREYKVPSFRSDTSVLLAGGIVAYPRAVKYDAVLTLCLSCLNNNQQALSCLGTMLYEICRGCQIYID